MKQGVECSTTAGCFGRNPRCKVKAKLSESFRPHYSLLAGFFFFLVCLSFGFAQNPSRSIRVWSVGPLTKAETVGEVAFGASGPAFTGARMDSQTESVFQATRRAVFAGDRIVIAMRVGPPAPNQVYRLLSLDAKTGDIRDSRDLADFGLRAIFATNDGHVILSGANVLRLTPDLKDEGVLDLNATGRKYARAENISPDGKTLGNATSPGYELVDARTLQIKTLTEYPAVDTSVSNKGYVTDNVHWVRDYPKDISFVTDTDASGQHLLYHGKCGGRPQFLSDDLILEPGCKNPLIIDIHGNLVKTMSVKGDFSYAGVSQNSKRFALQIASFTSIHSLKQERFVIYSTDTWEPVAEVTPDEPAEEQSWTAFSPDGSMFVVGSPLKLTLYRLP